MTTTLTIEVVPPNLRQEMLVYIVIKNILAPFNQIFILTSSIDVWSRPMIRYFSAAVNNTMLYGIIVVVLKLNAL